MFEYLWLPCMVTVAAIALSAILFKEFLKKRAGQIAVEGREDDDSATKNGTVERAAPTCTLPRVNETATPSGYDYEVFLSFRGPDTRKGITDFLYTSLIDAGIRAYRDDEELRIGEEIGPELLQAIDQSNISIPIFSKDYASSVWCLKELVQMVECQKTGGHKIMPIFYDVAPSEVRYQTGGYGKAFLSHEKKKRYDKETMRAWKAALSAVGALKGWDLHGEKNRLEGEFAKTVTREVFNELKKAYLEVSDCLVSVDNHVDAIMEKIGAETSETRIIGIHGMGGIGKTTIAKIIYNQLSKNFEHCCFLSNVRETSKLKGIHCLQHQLISDILNTKWIDINNIDEGIKTIKARLSNKRVLLLLDDVEEKDHMNALVGNHDWFGKGSKIIITTRNKEVLKVTKVDNLHEVDSMDRDRSLQLFSKHAFRRDSPVDEYIDQSDKAIGIAGGLPLALEVIGSLLSGKNKEMWDAILEKLTNVPPANVQGRLKISSEALDDGEKDIFLDIACLFIGYDKDILIHFWDALKLSPKVAMEVLQNMSLIKIKENNKVWMHDQLRDLGRMLVSKKKIEEQSRVWDPKEAFELLKRHKENKEVEALRLELDHERRYCCTYEGFESLSNLRFLEVKWNTNYNAIVSRRWHESPSNVLSTNKNSYLLPQLRWFSWRCIPPKFNIVNFSMENVVILNLSRSAITDDWKGWSHMKVMRNLKVLDLSACWRLQRLPDELCRDLASLEYLSVKSCTSLERLPDSIGNLESLIELDISMTCIKELPESIGKLKNLKKMKMQRCNISNIPYAFWTIEKLEEIQALENPGTKRVHVKIGNGISKNQFLRILRLDGVDIWALSPRLPENLTNLYLDRLYMETFPDLSNLTNLKELGLVFGSRDSDEESDGLVEYPIPRWIGNLTKLESLVLISRFVTTLPTDLSFPPQLKSLRLQCPNLRHLPTLPSSLSSLCLQQCDSLYSMEDLSNLKNLSALDIEYVAISEIPGLGCLENLQVLTLCGLGHVETLRGLPSSSSSLSLGRCESLCFSMEDLSNLKKLSSLYITHVAISEILGLGCLENLRDLRLHFLSQVKILPDLSNLNKLTILRVEDCGNLVEIQGELTQSLEKLEIESCESLRKLPDLSSLNRLQMVKIIRCMGLNVEAIYSLCSEKLVMFVTRDRGILM